MVKHFLTFYTQIFLLHIIFELSSLEWLSLNELWGYYIPMLIIHQKFDHHQR